MIIKKRYSIAVLFSGGVDSSVVLSILKDEGHDICAYYLKIWLEDELSYLGDCPWEEDLNFARQTCEFLKIPLKIISMQQAYWNNVVDYTINQIKYGNTPNPDMMCNKFVKLGIFFDDYGKEYDYIATGHYAKRIIINDNVFLGTTNDAIKDQTYFLAYTPYEKICKTLFPIGNLKNKSEVRNYAIEKKLPTASRPDSQGICFLGKIPFKKFVEHYCGISEGFCIEYETGKKLTTHNGSWFYTIGQRKDIGLSGGPWYVVEKNYIENIVYISKEPPKKNILIKNDIIKIIDMNWLIKEDIYPKINEPIKIKLRHGPLFNQGTIIKFIDNNNFIIKLNEKDQGIANGQFAVLYNFDEICFGGGVMNREILNDL
jgi:tRNA (5-methylaminomethyl-2-thiouridylate)-methyltransferase